MAYVHRSDAEPISVDLVQAVAGLLGLSIPDADLEAAAEALTNQLASVRSFEALDLVGIDPAVTFDPRWHADE